MRDTGFFSCVTAAQSPVNKLSFLSTLPGGPVNVMYPLAQRILGKGVSDSVLVCELQKVCSRKQVFLALFFRYTRVL